MVNNIFVLSSMKSYIINQKKKKKELSTFDLENPASDKVFVKTIEWSFL